MIANNIPKLELDDDDLDDAIDETNIALNNKEKPRNLLNLSLDQRKRHYIFCE